jgi:hypothetical protein
LRSFLGWIASASRINARQIAIEMVLERVAKLAVKLAFLGVAQDNPGN